MNSLPREILGATDRRLGTDGFITVQNQHPAFLELCKMVHQYQRSFAR